MIETVLPILCALGLAIIVGVEWSLRPKTRAWRALRRAPHLLIADIKNDAPARITGTASVIGQSRRSPIGDAACIGFQLEIAVLGGRDRTRVVRREECPPFAIADESGTATVDGPMLLALDWDDGGWSRLPEPGFAILQAAGILSEGFAPSKVIFRQALLRSGDRVTASGIAFLEPDPSQPTIEMRTPAVRPHLRGTTAAPVAVVGITGPGLTDG